MPNPTYEMVSSGTTNHVETVAVEYDPSVVSLDALLAVFFTTHDPTTPNRQGHDIGTQYRSAIFYTNEAQQKEIEKFIDTLRADKLFAHPIVTEVQQLTQFYPAEEYHQNYYRNNTTAGYCQAVINPKLAKLRAKFKNLLV